MSMGISASRMLLLLLMLIPGNLNFHISRRHEDVKKSAKKMVPSCAELLNMWHQMNIMTRHSLATNEIPVLPRNFLGFLLGITHTYPEQSSKHQGRSHFRKVMNRQNMYEEDVFSPFVKPSHDRKPDLLLKMGFSDPVETLYVDQGEFFHQPKDKPEILSTDINEKQSLHPFVKGKTSQAQHIVPKPSDSPEEFLEEPTKYERAYPLNEPSETSNLFGSFSDPFSEGFSSFSDIGDFPPATDDLQGSHSGHQTEKSGMFPDHQPKESLFPGFRKTIPETHLEGDVMDMFGTVLHDTEEEERWIQEGKQPKTFETLPQWMFAGDLGSFGSFASDNELLDDTEAEDSVAKFHEAPKPNSPQEGSLRVSEDHLQHPHFHQSDKAVRRQVTCIERTDRQCNSDLNCACTGWMTLKCVQGKCRRQEAFEVPEGFDLGIWHDNPLSVSELGMNRGRRRIMRNPWTPM